MHDYLNQYGGAERVVEVLHEIFPEAPIYTSIYISKNLSKSFRGMDIRVSFMQKLPFLDRHFKKYLLLYPKAMESFNLENYDVVLSSSSAFAKGVKLLKKTCHICYCYTPMRFVWDYENYIARENFGKVIYKVLPLAINKLRKWDLETSRGVNYFIAISENVRKRIKKYYHKEAEVIYPPVEVSKFKVAREVRDYFLVVSRLNSYKRVDLVIEAFNKLGLPLRVVGDGPYRSELEKMVIGKNIKFLRRVPDEKLIEIYSKCRAFIFPGEEDFGIAPVEAQASGRPVIAYAGGGALETIVEGVTGIFFYGQSVTHLINAVKNFVQKESYFKPDVIRKNALRFDKEIFKQKLKDFVHEKYNGYRRNIG